MLLLEFISDDKVAASMKLPPQICGSSSDPTSPSIVQSGFLSHKVVRGRHLSTQSYSSNPQANMELQCHHHTYNKTFSRVFQTDLDCDSLKYPTASHNYLRDAHINLQQLTLLSDLLTYRCCSGWGVSSCWRGGGRGRVWGGNREKGKGMEGIIVNIMRME